MRLRRAIFRRLRVWPVNRSALKTPGNLTLSVALGEAESAARMGTGGGSATGFEPSLLPHGCDVSPQRRRSRPPPRSFRSKIQEKRPFRCLRLCSTHANAYSAIKIGFSLRTSCRFDHLATPSSQHPEPARRMSLRWVVRVALLPPPPRVTIRPMIRRS